MFCVSDYSTGLWFVFGSPSVAEGNGLSFFERLPFIAGNLVITVFMLAMSVALVYLVAAKRSRNNRLHLVELTLKVLFFGLGIMIVSLANSVPDKSIAVVMLTSLSQANAVFFLLGTVLAVAPGLLVGWFLYTMFRRADIGSELVCILIGSTVLFTFCFGYQHLLNTTFASTPDVVSKGVFTSCLSFVIGIVLIMGFKYTAEQRKKDRKDGNDSKYQANNFRFWQRR